LQKLHWSGILFDYGSTKVASFKIKAGPEENAFVHQVSQAFALLKLQKAGCASPNVPALRILPGKGSYERARENGKKRS